MNLFRLLLAFLNERRASYALTVVLLATGVTVITLLLTAQGQLRQQLSRDAGAVDMVVGSKGSPLQLILSTLYHVDMPAGNIPATALDDLRRNRAVKTAVPVALGDNYRGFRIVGTEPAFPSFYGGTVAVGQMWTAPMQAVIGAEVAAQTGLQLGQRFVGWHGLAAAPAGDHAHHGHAHGEHPYEVTGILAPTGTVLDRLVLTPVESVHLLHADEKEAANDITAILVENASDRAALTLPRQINQTTNFQAASPAVEITRLFRMLDQPVRLLQFIGGVIVFLSLAGILVALYGTLEKRLHDMAVLRVIGWPRRKIALLVVAEGMVLALAGTLTGWLAGVLLVPVLGQSLGFPIAAAAVHGPLQLGILLLVLLGAGVACALPVWRAWRVNVAQLLARS